MPQIREFQQVLETGSFSLACSKDVEVFGTPEEQVSF